MKRIVLLFSFVLVFALFAGAQTYVDFHEMPLAKAPAVMPDVYPQASNLYWDNFFYVTPGLWNEAGIGFWIDPATRHNSVALVGGPMCSLAAPCFGTIKLVPMMIPNARTFTPVSVSLTAGWTANTLTVTGYNNGKFVGSLLWKLTTTPKTFTFPNTWKVTELVFTPGAAPVGPIASPKAGSMVIYSFIFIKN